MAVQSSKAVVLATQCNQIARRADCEITSNQQRENHTLSMPSISRALFVPLGGGGGATELRSSLPLAEEPGASDPRPRFLVAEAIEGLPEVARRCASMSFLRFAASSLFSSVSLRMRSCETQSSQLPRLSAKVPCSMAQIHGVAMASRGPVVNTSHEQLL